MVCSILNNALEACQSDHDTAKTHVIRFIARGEGDEILFKVIDNGPGMESDMHSKIFTPHFLSNKENGSGLGFYLAQRILEKHRGRISVDSTVGRGRVFRSIYRAPIRTTGVQTKTLRQLDRVSPDRDKEHP
jgi:signal transduction histidine kinase